MASQNFVTRPGSQFIQSGTGAVERTVTGKLQDVISVLDFGVVNDNGATDQSAKFQAALDAVAAYGASGIGATLYIPAGVYKAGNLLIKQQGTRILGDGQYNTRIVANPGSDYVLATWNEASRNPSNPTKPIRHLSIEGFTIADINNLNNVAGNAGLILAEGYSHSIRDFHVTRTGAYNANINSIRFNTGIYTTILDRVFCDDLVVADSKGTDPSTTVTCVQSDFRHVLIQDSSKSINFYGCTFQAYASASHPTKVAEINGTSQTVGFYGCHFETDIGSATGVWSNDTNGLTISGCNFYAFQGTPSSTGLSTNVVISGNVASATKTGKQFNVSNTTENVNISPFFDKYTNNDGNYIGKLYAATQPYAINAYDPDNVNNTDFADTSAYFLSASATNIVQILTGGNSASNQGYLQFGSTNGTRQAQIFTYSNSYLDFQLKAGAGNRDVRLESAAFLPIPDATLKLGTGGNRWTDVYATNATIQTSDEQEKEQIRSVSEKEKTVALKLKGIIKCFKWKDAVSEKGDDARFHFGVIAQEVADVFKAEGLSPDDYGLFCFDKWDDVTDPNGNVLTKAGSRYGVRYSELIMFILSAM